MDAALRFSAQALDTVGHAPEQVTTDGHDAYPRPIRETLGRRCGTASAATKTTGSSRTIAA